MDLDFWTPPWFFCVITSDLDLATLGLLWNSNGGGTGDRGDVTEEDRLVWAEKINALDLGDQFLS